MFKNITGTDQRYITAVRAAMVLSVALFVALFLMGVLTITQKELVVLMLKLLIIQQLISPGAWEFFYDYLFVMFVEGVDSLIATMTAYLADIMASADLGGNIGSSDEAQLTSANTFAFFDQVLARVFTMEVLAKYTALFSPDAFPVGLIYGLLILLAIIIYIIAVAKAVFVYVISVIGVGLLLAMAPIFIPFMMFKRTETFFDNWWKQLTSFAIQPVLLFTVLALFNVFIYSIFYKIMSFSVCWSSCAGKIDLMISELFEEIAGGISGDDVGLPEFDTICAWPGYVPWGMGGREDLSTISNYLPTDIYTIIMLLILVTGLLKFNDWIISFSMTLVGVGSSGVDLGGQAQKALGSMAGAGASALRSAGALGGLAKTAAINPLTKGITGKAADAGRSVTRPLAKAMDRARGLAPDKFGSTREGKLYDLDKSRRDETRRKELYDKYKAQGMGEKEAKLKSSMAKFEDSDRDRQKAKDRYVRDWKHDNELINNNRELLKNMNKNIERNIKSRGLSKADERTQIRKAQAEHIQDELLLKKHEDLREDFRKQNRGSKPTTDREKEHVRRVEIDYVKDKLGLSKLDEDQVEARSPKKDDDT